MKQSNKRIGFKIASVWTFTFLVTSYFSWFPYSFDYIYYPFIFIYFPDLQTDNLVEPYLILSVIAAFYLVMIFFICASGLLPHKANLVRSKMIVRRSNNNLTSLSSTHKILALIALTFTIFAVPLIISFGLYYKGIQVYLMMTIFTLFGMSYGSMNLLIFLWKDEGFRRFVKGFINKANFWLRRKLHFDNLF
ncbi:uncharacterized protein LOC143446851 [Clavelina lepadiformis]|uniref:uncharacterized protein LOC143446851 n=1 Tax=Clavelina lepadiformis TaxID=159417 RepID=UPI00404179A9